MSLTNIALISTEPEFYYQVIEKVEVSLEAETVFDSTPEIAEINKLVRQRAKELGADAVIDLRYERGMSLTSWRRLTAYGLAIRKAG